MSSNTASITLTSYLRGLFNRYKFYIISLAILAISAGYLNLSISYKIKEIIDTIATHPNDNIVPVLLLFIAYKMLFHGMFFISRLLDIYYKPRLLAETVGDIYSRTLGHSLHWFDSHLSGEVSSKISDFQNALITLISLCFRALNNVATIMISILFLSQVNMLSTTIIGLFVLIYSPIVFLLLKHQMKLQEHYATARQETIGIVNDSIANIFGIKVIGNAASEFKLKLIPALTRWKEWDKKTRKFDAYFVDNADTIMVTIMSGVQIFVLATLFRHGEISAGGFAFIAMITLNIHGELDKFLDSLLFHINPGIATLKSSFTFVSSSYDTQDQQDATILSNVQGKISFEHIHFSYSGNPIPVLQDFNLTIHPGERLGIVGTSGAGKTTLVKCLLRYFDIQQGHISIDHTDISSVTQESLRANISVIPQDITMFHRTILENLQIAKPEASFEEIVEACKRAKIHDAIMAMNHGYNAVVGERGVKVSGGQRQRIAIARAILKNAPILILDEATSALDTPTERLIQASLNEILETSKATVLAIAHRLSTLKHMDRIIVLDKGNIIEMGKHDELMQQEHGLYRRLWEMQMI